MLRNKVFKEIWENDEYGIHHVHILIRTSNEKGSKYQLSWKYGNYGVERNMGYFDEYLFSSKKIIEEKSKNRTEQEPPKPEPTGYGNLFGY